MIRMGVHDRKNTQDVDNYLVLHFLKSITILNLLACLRKSSFILYFYTML